MFDIDRTFLLAADSQSSGSARAVQSLAAFLRRRRNNIPSSAKRLGHYVRLPSRIGKPVTQEEIAEAVGVSRTWYRMLETRTGVRPSLTLLRRIAAALMLMPTERAQLCSLAVCEGEEYAGPASWHDGWLRDSKRLRLLDALLEQTSEGILIAEQITAREASIVYVNPAFERMSGYRSDYLRGHAPLKTPLRKHLHHDAVSAILGATRMFSPVSIDVAANRKDGSPLFVDLALSPIFDDDGQCRHWVASCREINRRLTSTP